MVLSVPRSAMAAAFLGYRYYRGDHKALSQGPLRTTAPPTTKPFLAAGAAPSSRPFLQGSYDLAESGRRSGNNLGFLHSVVRCEAGSSAGNSGEVLGPVREFREKLSRGERVIGIGIQCPGIITADALGPCSDFFWFDLEHMLCNPQDLLQQMVTARNKGVVSIVRVKGPNLFPGDSYSLPPGANSLWSAGIKNALDSGADGIVVPQVRSADDVRGIVADCQFPASGGRRGFGPTIPLNYGRIPVTSYVREADRSVFIGVMIETKEAMENLEEIAAVPRLDALVLGANDLSAALGVTDYNNNHPLVDAAIERILEVAKRHGKWVMFSTRSVEMAEKLALHKQGGAQILHVGHDILAMVSFQENLVKGLKHKLRQQSNP